MSRQLLSICFPTCNREEKLLHTVINLLSCTDSRFSIVVSDNLSTDETVVRLKRIQDNRLHVYSHTKKIPAYQNYNQVIQYANSDYVLHVLDKEYINPQYLVDFLDFLELEQPNFGLVDIFRKNRTDRFVLYQAGFESIKYGGGGGDTHPSGFYYRKSLYEIEYNRIKPIIKEGNLWVLDIVSAGLGAQYDSMVYYLPLISYDKNEILSGKTLSPYTYKTIYWYGGMRVATLLLFVKSIKCLTSLNSLEKEKILYPILERHIQNMTWTQVNFFKDNLRCSHYGLTTRKIGAIECVWWIVVMIYSFCREIRNCIPLRFSKLFIAFKKGIRTTIKETHPNLLSSFKK